MARRAYYIRSMVFEICVLAIGCLYITVYVAYFYTRRLYINTIYRVGIFKQDICEMFVVTRIIRKKKKSKTVL